MASTHVRLEDYASSGLVLEENKGVENTHSRIKLHPTRFEEGLGQNKHDPARVAHSASAYHRQHDRYMETFDVAFEKFSVAATERTGAQRHGIVTATPRPSRGLSAANRSQFSRKQTLPNALNGDLSNAWLQGPCVPTGEVHAVSAKPLMCMSMSADECEVVVGSSDHALYALPIGKAPRASRPRTLYSKNYGHTEWVTCVTHLSDRRIVSGGMDSKLCVWDYKGIKCEDLLGHTGSVSCVLSLSDELVVSTGYDKMLRLWNVGRRLSNSQREISVIKTSTAPILDVSLLFGGPQIVCGDRDGGVQFVDLQANKVLCKHISAHKGHTTSVLGSQSVESASCFYSGGQDGIVKVWDSKQKTALLSLKLHIDPRNKKQGAVSFIREPMEVPNVLLTAGADGVINVLDKRQSFRVLYRFTEHIDFIYSLHLRGQCCFSGAGNGMLHVNNWATGKLLYGLGANQAAVRAIATSTDKLVAAGDDGGVLMYDMK